MAIRKIHQLPLKCASVKMAGVCEENVLSALKQFKDGNGESEFKVVREVNFRPFISLSRQILVNFDRVVNSSHNEYRNFDYVCISVSMFYFLLLLFLIFIRYVYVYKQEGTDILKKNFGKPTFLNLFICGYFFF